MEQTLSKGSAKPADIYFKGDDFKGHMWIKMAGEAEAKQALTLLKLKCFEENKARAAGQKLWANFDTPFEKRVVISFLAGLRHQLIEWKFPKEYIKMDDDQGLLKAGGKDIVKATIKEDKLLIEWVNEEWETWGDLQKSSEYEELLAKAESKMVTHRSRHSKGAGKGPH